MNKIIPTYYEIEYSNSSKIFEAEQIKNLSPDQIQEAERAYGVLLEKLNKGEEIDEGFLTGLLGGTAGFLVGPAIGKAMCSALGIKEAGILGKLLTSRLVTTAMGVALGK